MTGYVNPDVLVETGWVAEHAADLGVRVVEADEDVTLYDAGHIPGAVKANWRVDLSDQRLRDLVDAPRFAKVMGRLGITRDTTVVFYGDEANWWAAYAYWVFRLHGHEKLRLMNGGRKKWLAEKRPLTREVPAVGFGSYAIGPPQLEVRALRADVLRHIGNPNPRQLVVRLPAAHALVDVRTPAEFSGRLLHVAGYPQEGALRGGHIPGAANIPWGRAISNDGTFKSADLLRRLYEGEGITPDKDVIVYCRIGERSALTWFVLHELLGYRRVRNYDGSWTEWGNSVGVPIANPSLVDMEVEDPRPESALTRSVA
ncbi:MAG: sulfurtransferase [Acidobacteria bacterium 37-65-4]|nr:MAG: sulfurtransferase [Acidobacteria bacterium 21-70-11]OYW04600.1 MAG: sulfurtransferase [Acidobacteria bacterium 37-65-4]